MCAYKQLMMIINKHLVWQRFTFVYQTEWNLILWIIGGWMERQWRHKELSLKLIKISF